MRAPLIILAACALVLTPAGAADAAGPWGPLASPNPYLGPVGTSTMHGDAGSSDATPLPLPGPGAGGISVAVYPLASACPTLLQGSDGLVVALCTPIVGRTPTIHLLDPAFPGPIGSALASLEIAKGSLLGGVYAYLDNADRLVIVDGNRALLRIGHVRDAAGRWRLSIDTAVDLASVIALGDNVTGLVPDWSGNVWFATGMGIVGRVTESGAAATVALPTGEQVANSISAAPSGRVAVATTHALYELAADAFGRPTVLWRAAYDRGSARKPGQLSWGTGSTPTYFGPDTGADYLAIVDNADGQVSALVFRSGSGRSVCAQPVLGHGGPGSENSPIGVGRALFVASTYGYPYPAVPEGAGPAVPPAAPFAGGMTRVDIDDEGCHTVWENSVRSAAVPHLSSADGAIYTVTRLGLDNTTPLDGYAFTLVNPDTGAVVSSRPLPGTIVADPLQTSPLLTRDRKVLQGTVTGVIRIS